MKAIILASTVAIVSLLVTPGIAGTNNGKMKISCADAVNHKHPGLKGDAWKAEWAKCSNDRPGYIAQ
jgi:hypothetical protein